MGYLRATTSFTGAVLKDGQSIEVQVANGQVVPDDHPAVLGREHMFEPLDEAVEGGRGRGRGGK